MFTPDEYAQMPPEQQDLLSRFQGCYLLLGKHSGQEIAEGIEQLLSAGMKQMGTCCLWFATPDICL